MSDPNNPVNPEGSSGGTGGSSFGSYGQPGDDTPYRASEAIAYGWRKFKASPSTLLIPMIVVFIALVVAELLIQFIVSGGFSGDSNNFWRQWLGLGLGTAVTTVIVDLLGAGLYRGAVNVTQGQPF